MDPISDGSGVGGGGGGSGRLPRAATNNAYGGGGGGAAVIAPRHGYALSGRIMLSSILALFSIVLFVLIIHLYARWYFLRRAASISTTRRRRRQQLSFAAELNDGNNNTSALRRGLDPSILKLIPISFFSTEGKQADTIFECAVCLCEFEDCEKVRKLPQCGHGFHVECIDMWFQSHSTCPLCRSPVSAPPPPQLAESQVTSLTRSEVSSRLEAEQEGTSGSGSKLPMSGKIGSLKRLLSGDLRIYCRGEHDLERGEAAASGERDH